MPSASGPPRRAPPPPSLLLSLLSLLPLGASGTAVFPEGWHKVADHSSAALGHSGHPAIRYNHGAVAVGGKMFATHGYFYNRETSTPEWQHDTWSFDLPPSGKGGWKRIAQGVDLDEARRQYKAGRIPSGPSGRYGVTLNHYKGKLYMFGGTDGGTSKHGRDGYESGYEMNELWELSVNGGSWKYIQPKGDFTPKARNLHIAVVLDDSLYVYGGNNDGAGDVVAFSFARGTWKQLVDEPVTAAMGPGPRLGHSAMVVITPSFRGFLVYGGRRRGDSMKKLAGDVWLFDAGAASWRGPLAAATSGGSPLPPPRLYAAMAPVDLPPKALEDGWEGWTLGVVSMGSLTTPLMTCTGESWALLVAPNASLAAFAPLPEVPVAHYHHSLVSEGTRLFSFGGHLCSSTLKQAEHPFYYLNWVEALDVSKGWNVPPSSAFSEATFPQDGDAPRDEL